MFIVGTVANACAVFVKLSAFVVTNREPRRVIVGMEVEMNREQIQQKAKIVAMNWSHTTDPRSPSELLTDFALEVLAEREAEVDAVFLDTMNEVEKATVKFPTWPTDPLHAIAVLGEEFGELTKAVLQSIYEPHKSNPDDVREEAIQTAAMAMRFLLSLDKYEYQRGEQHEQGK